MTSELSRIEDQCPSDEISSYVDGELSLARELEMDAHFAKCESCAAELNLQKKFLVALGHALESEQDEIDVPANFTKVVVANAESRVSGLRRRRERFHASLVCAGLLIFLLFTMGADSGRAFDGFMVVFEKIAAVAVFTGHFIYDVAVGTAVVLRTLTARVAYSSTFATLFPGLAALFVIIVSRVTALIGRS
jgi:anti-sigma factor RsiW